MGSPCIAASVVSPDTTVYNANGDIERGSGISGVRPFQPTFGRYRTIRQYNAVARDSVLSSLAPVGGAVTSSTTYLFDEAGNRRFESTLSQVTTNVTAERASFYSADDRLLAVDSRASGRRIFEEYRYDPLGRRVWVSTRRQCLENAPSGECRASSVRRTVWDGQEEYAEISAPYDAWVANGQEGTEELDVNFPVIPYTPSCSAGDVCDPNPFFGRVVYAPGLSIDRPLAVTRAEYRDNSGPPVCTSGRYRRGSRDDARVVIGSVRSFRKRSQPW